jgi:Zn-dependent protease with chaperone function
VWTFFSLILLSPLTFNLWARYASTRANAGDAEKVWLNSRRTAPILGLLMTAAWWAAWDFEHADFVNSPQELLIFWTLPLLSIALSQWTAAVAGKSILGRKWSGAEMVSLAFWSTVSPTAALLGVASGAELIYRGWWQGFLVLLAAGFVAIVAKSKLRSVEGLKFRTLRSGRLHGRAFQLAKRMGIPLQRVSIVPAGKGHLTNAYGLTHSIALTDNYGEFANGPQLDFVIGHELMHVAAQHARKKAAIAVALYLFFSVVFFHLPPLVWRFRGAIDLLFLFAPTLALRFLSRRFEYASDRGAVDLTRDPEAAVNALVDLHRITGAPIQCGRIIEIFQTHPSLERRAAAIAVAGDMPLDKLTEILHRPENRRRR